MLRYFELRHRKQFSQETNREKLAQYSDEGESRLMLFQNNSQWIQEKRYSYTLPYIKYRIYANVYSHVYLESGIEKKVSPMKVLLSKPFI